VNLEIDSPFSLVPLKLHRQIVYTLNLAVKSIAVDCWHTATWFNCANPRARERGCFWGQHEFLGEIYLI
jgi:hypothetical protein